MTQKIYLAGSSKPAERPRVAAIMGQLHVMAGLHVVHDWLMEVDANDVVPEHALDARTRRSAMDLDYNAIDVADYMWFLAPPPESPTKGGWCELGYATCRSRMTGSPLILISGEHRFQSIFTEAAHRFFEQDMDALEFLRARVMRMRSDG